jgi:hypothetical protein
MKKIVYTLIVMALYNAVNAQIINFPDSNFKNKLLTSTASNYVVGTGYTVSNQAAQYIKIDANDDGEIEVSEVADITTLNVSNANINSLVGIEYFNNLKRISYDNNNVSTLSATGIQNLEILSCATNHLTSLTFLSGFSHLKYLTCAVNNLTSINLNWMHNLISINCDNNQITMVDFSGLSSLKYFYCRFNQLSVLDFSSCPMIEKVACSNNQLTTLDFRNNPNFIDLGCANNNLNSIYIKNGSTQNFVMGGLHTSDNWNNNPNLNYICADASELTAVQNNLVGYNLNNITFTSNCDLGVEGFNKSEVGVFPNPVQNQLSISNEETMQYELFTILGAKIQAGSLAVHGQVDCSSLAKGLYLLKLNKDNGESKVVKVVKD